jgi:hypothetical protein
MIKATRRDEAAMAGSSKDAWGEAGERFADWGRLLAEHYKQRGEALGAVPEEDRRKLEEAASAVTRQLDRAFSSLGETLRDPAARQTLKDAARAMAEAISATLAEIGEKVRGVGPHGPGDAAG